MNKLIGFKANAEKSGGSTGEADQLIQQIACTNDVALLAPLFARLDTASDLLGWSGDCDYAAIALQAALEQAGTPKIREAMLGFALERARWCASCATSGGEGWARSMHVRELEALTLN